MADWHYIGHYGQLGPLNDSQMAELIAGGVIERGTYVWCEGMPDWLPASSVSELRTFFSAAPSAAVPPPPPPGSSPSPVPPFGGQPAGVPAGAGSFRPMGTSLGVIGQVPGGMDTPPPPGPVPGPGYYAAPGNMPYGPGYSSGMFPVEKSDKNRYIAGILNIILPGVGRMYLGYSTIGVIQFILIFAGVGIFWGLVDGLLMLTGNVKEDGYGRELL